DVARGRGPVGRQDGVLEGEDRVARRRRLDLEDVEARARDPALPERTDERRLIDQLASGHVDEVRRGLHERELGLADHGARAVRETAVEAYEVRFAQDLLEAREPHAERRGLSRVGVRREGKDAHAEGRDEAHELALGSIGRNGTYAANEATRNADVILAIGFSFDDRATSAWLDGYTLSIPPTRLIQVDTDAGEIGRNYPAHLGIIADARAFLSALGALARGRVKGSHRAPEAWLAKLGECRELWNNYQRPLAESDATPVRPERLMRAISRVAPENTILATDVGVHHNWVVQLWRSRKPRHLLQSWGFAAMGYATSGILGAKLAAPDKPAVAVVGDGAFLMTPHVLATAAEYDIPAVWVVWNNYGYASIRDLQLGFFGKELATSFENHRTRQLYNPDFAQLAQSFGVDGMRVTKPGDIEGAIERAIRLGKPALVEVGVDRDIRPVGTGSWALPPLPHPEPNFLKAAGIRK
ncbi:MAG: thiamine pyrophosphate-binding protein, partial [Betaproteobacteria bacterium]|nr:thiamine pyrophosphate-binding protein [Betaproteobacteria bacterium]